MRLPPVWVAVLTVSATLSLSNSVSGQTVSAGQPAPDNSDAQSEIEVAGVPARNDLWKLPASAEETNSQTRVTGFEELQSALKGGNDSREEIVSSSEDYLSASAASTDAKRDSDAAPAENPQEGDRKGWVPLTLNPAAPRTVGVSALESELQTPPTVAEAVQTPARAENEPSIQEQMRAIAPEGGKDKQQLPQVQSNKDGLDALQGETNPQPSEKTENQDLPPLQNLSPSVTALQSPALTAATPMQPLPANRTIPESPVKTPIASWLQAQSTPAPLLLAGKTISESPVKTPIASWLQAQGTPVPPPPAPRTQPANQSPPTTPVPVPPAPRTQPANQCPDPNAPQVLVAEIAVRGVEGPLLDEVYRSIRTQPGRTTNRCQLQEDVNAIFSTGQFASVDYLPEDTPLGVRVTFVVQQNPVLRNVVVSIVPGDGKQAIPQTVVDEIFSPQYGQILNLRRFQEGVKRLNQWYKDNGYILAQVVGSSPVDANGTVTLQVAEGIIEDIQVRFLNKEGEETDKEGRAIQGRTRKFIITREMLLKPGEVLQESTLIGDLRRIYGLGIFEKVEPTLNPGQDPRKVVVVLNVTERRTGSVAAGAGISSATGLFGTVSYQEQNLGGNNQKIGAQLQVGERALLFDVSFTDPWIAGDPFRTSYTVNGFRRRSLSLVFTGGDDEVDLPNGDRPRILRLGGGVTFTRPLGPAPLDAEWKASLGFEYQRVAIRDIDGEISPKDELGNDLSWSGEGKDDLLSLQFGIGRDLRDNPLKPTSGSVLRFSTEQFLPVGLGSVFGNRLRGSYSYYIPVQYLRFSKGPQTLAFNVQAGTFIGDLPPYEAFALGGSNSVRGWDEGELGSGRSFLQATVEYRFPIFSVVGGALFVDVGTDLGSGSSVPGNPAGVRGKPGSGFGYGLGVRVDSPLGPIRVDFGFGNEGGSRFHFGIGERF